MTATATDARSAEQFVEAFTEVWANPTPDRLLSLLHDDVRLVAPMARTTVGKEAARVEWTKLFALLPDLRADVHRWGANGNSVFIEFTLSATAGGRPFQWDVIDRFTIEDGLARERVSYFDSAALVPILLRHPGLALRMLRQRLR